MIRQLPFQIDTPRRQMALDDALLAAAPDLALRFYGWSPFGLSLGWFQEADAATVARAAAAGVDIVRRRTGGGAILHAREITYAIAGPEGEPPFDGDVSRSYSMVHDAIIAAAAQCGVFLRYAADHGAPGALKRAEQPFWCYARSTALDLVVDAGKVVGSAKRRRGGRALQHGSIVLLAHPLGPGQIGMADVLGRPIDPGVLAQRIAGQLADRIGRPLADGTFSAAELAHAASVEETFAADYPRERVR